MLARDVTLLAWVCMLAVRLELTDDVKLPDEDALVVLVVIWTTVICGRTEDDAEPYRVELPGTLIFPCRSRVGDDCVDEG